MKLTLHHVKNVDLMHGQGDGSGYWQPPIEPGKRRQIEVKSLADASAQYRAWIDRNGLGGGNMALHSGEVVENGRVIARISYNGRIWEPGEWPTKEIIP